MQYNQTQFQPQAQWAPARWVRVGVGWRFLALLIDGLIIGLIASIISIAFFPYGLLATDAGRLYLDAWPVVGLGGSTGLVGLAYYIILEATRGATFGKMALRMRVVKVDGSPIGWSE